MRIHRLTLFHYTLYLLLVGSGFLSIVYSDTTSQANQVYSVDIHSTINPGTARILKHAIRTAEQNNAAALLLRINTPGGLISSTRDMVTLISEAKIPIITYVGPSGANAGSAGAFILLAGDIAVMNSGTNVGASSPVSGEGHELKGTLGKKIMNDSKAFMRSIAEKRKRNITTAERFVSEAISLTAQEALEQNVIDLVVNSEPELLKQLAGYKITFSGKAQALSFDSTQATKPITPKLLDQLLVYIAHPQIAHLLISLGILGIYIEIISPGLAFPGIFGAIAVILGLVSVQTLPVNIGFLMLLFLGIALMSAEYFVSGFGVLGIGGATAFIVGSLYLFDTPPPADQQSGILSISIAVSASIILITFLITRSIFKRPKQKDMLGKTGEAMMNFDQNGYVLIEGQRWPAISHSLLHSGELIRVTKQDSTGILTVVKHDSHSANYD